MLSKKRIIIYIIIAIFAAAIIMAGTVVILNKIMPKPQTTNISPKDKGDSLKSEATEALNNNDTTKATALLKEAQDQYKLADYQSGVIDTDSMLFMIDHVYNRANQPSGDPIPTLIDQKP